MVAVASFGCATTVGKAAVAADYVAPEKRTVPHLDART